MLCPEMHSFPRSLIQLVFVTNYTIFIWSVKVVRFDQLNNWHFALCCKKPRGIFEKKSYIFTGRYFNKYRCGNDKADKIVLPY